MDRDRAPRRDTARDRATETALDRDRQQRPGHAPLRHDDIYGHELMSAGERNAYREKIPNAGSTEERERRRAQHQAEIAERARSRPVDRLC